jgi:hypothetical protein
MNFNEVLELTLSHYVITVGGRYSRGKSLIISALSFFDILLNERTKFLTNMPINFNGAFPKKEIEYKPLISTSQFDNLPKDTNIIWDEMQQDLFSRNSNSIKNKFVVIFGRDIAKLGCKLFGSFQFGDTIDKVMGFAVEIIIIPEYYETYSKNIKEDNALRVENKDFRINWTIYDKRNIEEYYISGKDLNLYPIIFNYNTKYKMNPLFVNHKEYIEKMKRNDFEHYEMIKTSEINDRVNNWNNGNKQIGKINIR